LHCRFAHLTEPAGAGSVDGEMPDRISPHAAAAIGIVSMSMIASVLIVVASLR
jgi:hypothetical protein